GTAWRRRRRSRLSIPPCGRALGNRDGRESGDRSSRRFIARAGPEHPAFGGKTPHTRGFVHGDCAISRARNRWPAPKRQPKKTSELSSDKRVNNFAGKSRMKYLAPHKDSLREAIGTKGLYVIL